MAVIACFSTPLQVKDATHAVTQLHGQAVTATSGASSGGKKGKQKKAAAAAEGVGDGESTVLWARQVAGEGAHVKQYRVIIRNLPFQVRLGLSCRH